jgi:DNA-binding XRE family transcriptional regulator
MGKKAGLFEEAKRLYVQEGLTLATIAQKIQVSQQSLVKWKAEGEWENWRAKYIKSEDHFSDVLNDLKKKLVLKALEDPAPQNIYALCRIVAVLKPSAAVELKKIEEEEKKKSSPEDMKKALDMTLEEIYGIKKDGEIGRRGDAEKKIEGEKSGE